MPFIWDDLEWKLVDEEEAYDKSRFVVARKLRVKPMQFIEFNAANQVFSVESIRGHFRKFGEIESIEMLLNSENEPEAHVTFASDQIACFVQSYHELNKKMYGHLQWHPNIYDDKINELHPYEIEPANTWEQPSQKVNPPSEEDMEIDVEQTSEIFMLNEDCLLHLFRFLDLRSLVNMTDVCKMFNQLLHQYTFKRIRKYEVACNPKLSLAQTRRELLCVGRHITDLYFQADYEEGFEDELVETNISFKVLGLIAQNVGQNIRRAYFGLRAYELSRLTIAPILQNLEALEICDTTKGHYCNIDISALCPNLVYLNVRMDTLMIASNKPWPSLLALSVMENRMLQPETLISFIEQNPQIKCLEFTSKIRNPGALFTAITAHLWGLEKLTIGMDKFDSDIHGFAEDFNHLRELPHLREISLYNLGLANLKRITDHLRSFKNLRKIELYAPSIRLDLTDYEQSLVNLVKQLSFLEEFQLADIPIEEETLVDMVRFGRHLKLLRIYKCKLSFSDELILELVDVLKRDRKESDKALPLFLWTDDLDELEAAKNTEIKRFIRLNDW